MAYVCTDERAGLLTVPSRLAAPRRRRDDGGPEEWPPPGSHHRQLECTAAGRIGEGSATCQLFLERGPSETQPSWCRLEQHRTPLTPARARGEAEQVRKRRPLPCLNLLLHAAHGCGRGSGPGILNDFIYMRNMNLLIIVILFS